MAIQYRSLFCDESETDAPVFYIGGIECSQRRSEILCAKIAELRKREHFYHEFKWQRIGNNEKYVALYRQFLDVFLNDDYSNMRIIRFNKKDRDWKRWSSDEDQRFFKCYYYFLMKALKPYARYDIYLDEKNLIKPYYWDSLYWTLTNKFKACDTENDYRNKKVVRRLKPVNSKKTDLIQLVDVLMKSHTAMPIGEGRMAIVNYMKQHIKSSSIYISDWVFNVDKVTLKAKWIVSRL
jgi:hypothetical protein